MDEEAKPNSDDFDFWLTICALLTFLCYTLFGVLIFLLRRIVNDAFRELLRTRTFKPSIETVFPLTNIAAITKLIHNETEGSLSLSLSLRRAVSMFILRNVPLIAFHNAMLTPTTEFLRFLRDTATEEVPIKSQDISVRTNEERVNINDFRRSYDLVFAFFDEDALDDKKQDEQVVLSLYMVHVKQHQEERRPTQILYSYCKTNRDRLICIRVRNLFDSVLTNLPYGLIQREYFLSRNCSLMTVKMGMGIKSGGRTVRFVWRRPQPMSSLCLVGTWQCVKSVSPVSRPPPNVFTAHCAEVLFRKSNYCDRIQFLKTFLQAFLLFLF